MNLAAQINAVLRDVEFDDAENVITLAQSFDAPVEDLWRACTDPQALARWFEPVDGELRPGGRYTMVDSGTTGTIETCEPSMTLALTWEYDGDVSWVTASFEQMGSRASRLTISHRAATNDYWRKFGPAAGGSGWDAALAGLSAYLENTDLELDDVNAAMMSPTGADFVERAIAQWSDAHQRAGATRADADAAAAAALEVERAQWEPDD